MDEATSNEQHEAKCRRCGRCCYHKLLIGGMVVYTDVPCAYLDTVTKLCRVYERRHEVNASCLDVPKGIKRGVFPADCPYVADVPGYRPPIEHPSPEMLVEIMETLEEIEW